MLLLPKEGYGPSDPGVILAAIEAMSSIKSSRYAEGNHGKLIKVLTG